MVRGKWLVVLACVALSGAVFAGEAPKEKRVEKAPPKVNECRYQCDLALLNMRYGKLEEAMQACEAALQKAENDNDKTMAMSVKAECLAKMGKTDDAIALMQEASEKNPNDKKLQTSLLNLYVAGKRKDDAKALMKKMCDEAKEEKDKARCLMTCAEVCSRMGDVETCKDYLHQVKALPDVDKSHERADKMLERFEKVGQPKETGPKEEAKK